MSLPANMTFKSRSRRSTRPKVRHAGFERRRRHSKFQPHTSHHFPVTSASRVHSKRLDRSRRIPVRSRSIHLMKTMKSCLQRTYLRSVVEVARNSSVSFWVFHRLNEAKCSYGSQPKAETLLLQIDHAFRC